MKNSARGEVLEPCLCGEKEFGYLTAEAPRAIRVPPKRSETAGCFISSLNVFSGR